MKGGGVVPGSSDKNDGHNEDEDDDELNQLNQADSLVEAFKGDDEPATGTFMSFSKIIKKFLDEMSYANLPQPLKFLLTQARRPMLDNKANKDSSPFLE